MTTAKFSALLEANVRRVFNERDEKLRALAIEELYSPDATLYEPEGSFTGTKAIADAVTRLLGALPPRLTFALGGPVLRNHDLAKLQWRGILPDGAARLCAVHGGGERARHRERLSRTKGRRTARGASEGRDATQGSSATG